MEEPVFWAATGGVLAWLVAAWVKTKAPPRGRRCRYCAYDLIGMDVDDRCPECGNMYSLRQHASLVARIGLPLLCVTIGTFGIGAAVAQMSLSPALLTMMAAALALSAACFTTVALSSRTRPAGVALLSLGAFAPCTGVILLMCYSAFVANPDPQSGLVIFVLPPVGALVAGYGILFASVLCTELELWW